MHAGSEANLDPAIIITSIEASEVAFAVSPQGLIALSKEKVPQPIVAAMIKRAQGPAQPATVPAGAAGDATAEKMLPSEVILVDGTEHTPMRYLTPQMRTAARGPGFGGVATYAVLRGTSASLRTKNPQPSFLVSVPDQAQVESYVTLASFAVRPNGSREVLVGGGYMSYSTGIHPDRVVRFEVTLCGASARKVLAQAAGLGNFRSVTSPLPVRDESAPGIGICARGEWRPRRTGVPAVLARYPAEVQSAYLRFSTGGGEADLGVVVHAALREYMPRNVGRETMALGRESRLIEDLGLDSLGVAEMVFFFEDLFDVSIPSNEIAGLKTVADLEGYVRAKLQAAKAASSAVP